MRYPVLSMQATGVGSGVGVGVGSGVAVGSGVGSVVGAGSGVGVGVSSDVGGGSGFGMGVVSGVGVGVSSGMGVTDEMLLQVETVERALLKTASAAVAETASNRRSRKTLIDHFLFRRESDSFLLWVLNLTSSRNARSLDKGTVSALVLFKGALSVISLED
jgi:hypothetical protein